MREREREREREGEGGREGERHRDRDRQTDRQTERERLMVYCFLGWYKPIKQSTKQTKFNISHTHTGCPITNIVT